LIYWPTETICEEDKLESIHLVLEQLEQEKGSFSGLPGNKKLKGQICPSSNKYFSKIFSESF